MTAVFFIASGFLDGSLMFNDRVAQAIGVRFVRIPATEDGTFEELPLGNDAERRTAAARFLRTIKHGPPQERNRLVGELERQLDAVTAAERPIRPKHVRALHPVGMSIGLILGLT